MNNGHEHSTADPQHHITSIPTYLMIFGALMVLTILTVIAANIQLGWLNTPVALIIATVKATLVIMFFMHARHSTRLVWAVIIMSIVMVGVLFTLTFSDYLSRSLSHL